MKPSALTTLISSTTNDSKAKPPNPLHALTIQVYHNLQHQHLWTSLAIHNPSSDDNNNNNNDNAASLSGLPAPLISGIPPQRIYTHPDEQLYLLEIGLREEDLPPERLWVLPSTQAQTWTLGKLASFFDALPPVGEYDSSEALVTPEVKKEEEEEPSPIKDQVKDQDKEDRLAKYRERRREADRGHKWGGKRLLLAMVDRVAGGDGTVVYYVVQEGQVKPRQN